ncbi:MAG: DUF4272 domain-containing protein [Anaerolineae bacterium]|nr:DUF4272 domain-containing protein [Anaerolineae bacterium]MDW8173692.1 DUF4272 domain-containing protein [Anaerolineae bacterium]
MSKGLRHEREVAQRALCSGALLRRWQWEYAAHWVNETTLAAHQCDHQALVHWLQIEGLGEALSYDERNLLRAPLGSWSLNDLARVLDSAERLAVLLWALSHLETLPPYDTPSNLSLLLMPLEILTPSIDFVWCARLRPQAELEALREEATLWQWRAQAEDLERMGLRTAEGQPMRAVIRQALAHAQAQGRLQRLYEGDVTAFGRPYARLSAPQHALARAISTQRAHAVAWVCDAEASWG